MNWCTIDVNYIEYLKTIEIRIPNIDYGEGKFKPFFKPLFIINDLVYVTQISSPKEKHKKLKENLDFKKIYRENNLIGVVNLNYMFPVPMDKIIDIEYKNIDKYKKFNNSIEKSKYIALLKHEMSEIIKKEIDISAEKLYKIITEKENTIFHNRCFDYKKLELAAFEFKK